MRQGNPGTTARSSESLEKTFEELAAGYFSRKHFQEGDAVKPKRAPLTEFGSLLTVL
jgi:hypothetical protein